jgi:glycosyltransferase involved in cell wall biosynthesis
MGMQGGAGTVKPAGAARDNGPSRSSIPFFVLCKNEASNIGKCVASLRAARVPITVLDSGSSDDTLQILRDEGVDVVAYPYKDHCTSYNDLTTRGDGECCGIIDADMEVSAALAEEIVTLLRNADVVRCPVRMCVEGVPLQGGSLYPDKPVAFRRGRAYFEPVGHGERLVSGLNVATTREMLVHNDLKPFASYIASQLRYAEKFAARAAAGRRTWRDWLRFHTPLMVVITPAYSLLVRGGVFFRAGWLYAIDRLIAEAMMFRKSLEGNLDKK